MRGVAKTSANSGLGQIGAPERQATCGPQAVPDPEAAERHANLLAEQMEEARDRETVWSHQFVQSREVRRIAAEPLDYARDARIEQRWPGARSEELHEIVEHLPGETE